MNDKNRPHPSRGGKPPIQRRPTEPHGASSDELMELADQLEEQARELLRHARYLQRLAAKLDQPERRPPFRGPRVERSAARGEGEGRERSSARGAEGGGARPPSRRSSAAPPWVPKGKRTRREK